MYTNYIQETEEWWSWWLTEDYGKRAQQAAFIYETDESFASREDLLNYITETVSAEQVQVLDQEEYNRLETQNTANGVSTCSTALSDGRRMVLHFHSSLKQERMSFVNDEMYFLSQIQAGLPGPVCILNNDTLTIYPKDEKRGGNSKYR
ncbi:MAG: hypothetical protein IJ088_00070 [Clostridia bacterium]|nr:hypothetical protein [Clostridia bacterium]